MITSTFPITKLLVIYIYTRKPAPSKLKYDHGEDFSRSKLPNDQNRAHSLQILHNCILDFIMLLYRHPSTAVPKEIIIKTLALYRVPDKTKASKTKENFRSYVSNSSRFQTRSNWFNPPKLKHEISNPPFVPWEEWEEKKTALRISAMESDMSMRIYLWRNNASSRAHLRLDSWWPKPSQESQCFPGQSIL